jgi:hypothetical protein
LVDQRLKLGAEFDQSDVKGVRGRGWCCCGDRKGGDCAEGTSTN